MYGLGNHFFKHSDVNTTIQYGKYDNRLFQNGKAIGIIKNDLLFQMNGNSVFNGTAPSFDGQATLLYQAGNAVGRINTNDQLENEDGSFFTGRAPSFDGQATLLYQAGIAVGRINTSDQLENEDGSFFTGSAPSFDGKSTLLYQEGMAIGTITHNNRLTHFYGKAFNGHAPSFDGKLTLLYQQGEALWRITENHHLVDADDKPVNGMAPSFDGRWSYLYEKGIAVAQFNTHKDVVLNFNGEPFSGFAPSSDGRRHVEYVNGMINIQPFRPVLNPKILGNTNGVQCHPLFPFGGNLIGSNRVGGHHPLIVKPSVPGAINTTRPSTYDVNNGINFKPSFPSAGNWVRPNVFGGGNGIHLKPNSQNGINLLEPKKINVNNGIHSKPIFPGSGNGIRKNLIQMNHGPVSKGNIVINNNIIHNDIIIFGKNIKEKKPAFQSYGKIDLEFKNGILYEKNQPFSGMASDGLGNMQAYAKGLKLVPLPDSYQALIVKQQGVCDCYALTIMYGLLSNRDTFSRVQKDCHFEKDGSFTVQLTVSKDVKYNGLVALENKEVQERMQREGYAVTISKKDQDIAIKVTIKPGKLDSILRSTDTVISNSMFIVAMEYVLGNMVRDVKNNEKAAEDPTVIAHRGVNRAEGSNEMVGNLLGYTGKPLRYSREEELVAFLDTNDKAGRGLKRLATTNTNEGFVYVGIEWGEKINNAYHGRHALALYSVLRERNDSVVGVYLVNPHDTSAQPRYFTVKELMDRKHTIWDYKPS